MNMYIASVWWSLTWLLIVQLSTAAEDSDEDFVPNFFGGRRNEGEHSGMGPPHPAHPKTRSGPQVDVRTLNFAQKLDHFNKCNKRVWNQRYMVNDAYFQPRANGPIFIRVGGEDEIFEEDLQDGPLIRLAKEHKALVLSLEHRFYGESKPTSDTKTKNLRYLSSRQALEDLEALVQSMKKMYEVSNSNARVILYGCSYAGSLAAFHRRMYPDSTSGAIAGFAPIFAVANFDSYFDGVYKAIGNQCRDRVEEAIAQTVCLTLDLPELCPKLVTNASQDRSAMLYDAVEFCEPKQFNKTNPNAVSSLVNDMLSRIMSAAQYNRKHSDGSSEVGTFCRYMSDASKGQYAFQRYGTWRKEVDGRCIIHHGKSIQTLAASWTGTYVKSGTRQWLYQMCSEFGYFVAGDTRYHMQTCQKSFDILDIEANVEKTNAFYGGQEGMNSTNIYFLGSKADPWYYANWLKEYEPRNPTMRIKTLRSISHCHEPMGECSEEKELVDAWNDIGKYVSQWIGKQEEGPGIFSVCA